MHKHNLEELEKKQSELEKAHGDVHDALSTLSTEKEAIDKEIKEKVLETEKLRVEFRKKAAERAAAERAAAMEREKAIMTEKQEERKRKAEQIRETEQIEGKAIQLHGKAKELQRQKLLVKDARVEVAEEIRKLKANIKFAQRAKKAAEKIKERIAERKEWLKKRRESELELRKQQREQEMKERELERERRQGLQDSCPEPKIRSYECNSDGLRLVKIFRFHYDFDQDKCVPRVQRKTVACGSFDHSGYGGGDMDGDGYDDVTGASTTPEYSRWKFGGSSGGYGDSYGGYGGGYKSHADDYA